MLAATLLVLGAVAVVVAGVVMPVRVDPPRPVHPTGGAGATSADDAGADAADAGPTLEQLQQVAAIDLRRPLYDQVVEAEKDPDPSPPPTPPPPLQMQLIATTNEKGNSMAIFRRNSGAMAVCAVGKSIEDNGRTVTVKAIDGGVVTIEYAGQTQKLEVRGP